MARDRKDAPNGAPESGTDSSAQNDFPNKNDNANPPDGNDIAADEAELLKVLEELSDTIDTAHQALDEQQRLVSGGETAGIEPDYSRGAEAQAMSGQEPPPLKSAALQSGGRGFGPVLATVIGGGIAAAVIAMLWIYWQPGSQETVPVRPAEPVAEKRKAPPQETDARGTASAVHSEASNGPPELWKNDPLPQPKRAKPAGQPEASKKTASIEKPKPRPPARQVTPPDVAGLDKGEEASILERGTRLVASGDFASARLLFEFAASRRSAAAMYALARTYDPDALAETGSVGIKPDMQLALRWYREAAGEGHKAATTRLVEIEARVAADKN